MSRSNYSDECEGAMLNLWRGAVLKAIKGARGQVFLQELAAALDAMPEKRLIAEDLEDEDGDVCAFGCVGRARGQDMSRIDPEEPEQVAAAFGIAPALAQEIVFINDEWRRLVSPEERWATVRRWVENQITK